mmetsp:Transcript_22751/g.67017  ORF Transcript_22751/g.67017 Transcript_22751/m.67017 type:complete len:486 (-) Transcript_22751:301-1758(-)
MHTAGLAMNMLADDDDDDDDDENPTHGPSAEGLREQLTMFMTIAALLAGFAVGLATTVSSEEIRAYARWELRTFLGRNSTLCEKYEPLGLIETDGGPTHGLRTCNPDTGCWDGYASWGTRAPDSPLVRDGLDQCSARAEGLFFEDLVLAKEVITDQELGRNTMIVIWVTMFVEMLGTVLFFSLLRTSSEGGEVAIWHSTFGAFLFVLYFLPVLNFYNFLMLASRVVKVKFVHCDDDFTGACWVEETPMFNRLALAACLLVVVVLALQTRLSWRLAAKRAEAAKQAVAKRALTRARSSRFSPGLLSRQASSLSKGAGEASSPLPPASAAAVRVAMLAEFETFALEKLQAAVAVASKAAPSHGGGYGDGYGGCYGGGGLVDEGVRESLSELRLRWTSYCASAGYPYSAYRTAPRGDHEGACPGRGVCVSATLARPPPAPQLARRRSGAVRIPGRGVRAHAPRLPPRRRRVRRGDARRRLPRAAAAAR